MPTATEKSTDFTEKELQILQFSADGKKNRDIAECLGTTEQVVKNIRERIMSKTDSCTFTHSVATALRRGLID